jgi:hypothetical protein
VKAPPRSGPATDATPKTAPKKPWKSGRLWRGTLFKRIEIAPVKIPEEPKPAIARPMMRAMELGAAPQRAEPTSNKKIPVRKTHFVGAKVYIRP